MPHSNPVSFVPVKTGIASSTAPASENGVSLIPSRYQHQWRPSYQSANTPTEPTIARRRNECVVRAVPVVVIRATTQAGRAVPLCARRVAYGTRRASHGVSQSKRSDGIEQGIETERTGIDVEIRQVEHFDTLPARFLPRRKRVGFWLCKPTGEVERWRRGEGTRREKVLAYQLMKMIRRGQHTSAPKS
jgi:hypothetical protein